MISTRVINKFILVYITGLIVACSGNGKDGSHVKTRTINNIKYVLEYMPAEAFKNDADSIKIADLAYYKLTISEEKNSGKIEELFSQSNYNKLLYYVNKGLQNDFKSVYGDTEISPVQVHFENNMRLTQKMTFLVAFEKFEKNTDNILVEYNDNVFNNGPIKFSYKTKDLNTL
jgi:hypothetical protein